jgi:hypothetical protein
MKYCKSNFVGFILLLAICRYLVCLLYVPVAMFVNQKCSNSFVYFRNCLLIGIICFEPRVIVRGSLRSLVPVDVRHDPCLVMFCIFIFWC